MKKQLIATSIILSLATAPVLASTTLEDTDNSSEIIGFSTGAIIGGIVAGPIGIVAAGAIGVIIGQSYDRQEQVELAQMHLDKNAQAMQTLADEKQRLTSRLMQTEQDQALLNEKIALSEKTLNQAEQLEKIKLNLRFEVDSSHVESFYKPQIKHLAMMMQENPEVSVSLSGFADPSGNEQSNMKLSQARTESVKTMLVDYGVDEDNIVTQAFGESTAAQISRTESSDFNNRRVEVELISQEPVVAQLSDESPVDESSITDSSVTESIGAENEITAETSTESNGLSTASTSSTDNTIAATLTDITHEEMLLDAQQTAALTDVN